MRERRQKFLGKQNKIYIFYNTTTLQFYLQNCIVVVLQIFLQYLGYVWVRRLRLRLRLRFSVPFFFTRYGTNFTVTATVHALCEQQPQSLTYQTIFSQSVHIVYCSRIHKFHFSATFSLKVGLTVLFIHLKIILLQCFSVFSCIQTDPWYIAFRMWEVFEGKMLNKTYIAFQVRML